MTDNGFKVLRLRTARVPEVHLMMKTNTRDAAIAIERVQDLPRRGIPNKTDIQTESLIGDEHPKPRYRFGLVVVGPLMQDLSALTLGEPDKTQTVESRSEFRLLRRRQRTKMPERIRGHEIRLTDERHPRQ